MGNRTFPRSGNFRPEVPIPNDALRTDVTSEYQRMERELATWRRLVTIAVYRLPEHELRLTQEEVVGESPPYELHEGKNLSTGDVILTAVPLPVYPERTKRATRFRDGD